MTRRTGNLPYRTDWTRGPKTPFREPPSHAEQLARLTHYNGRREITRPDDLLRRMYPGHDF